MPEALLDLPPLTLAVALASAGVPLAALAGLVGYFELRRRLAMLPAAVARDALEAEVRQLQTSVQQLKDEESQLERKRGELEALRGEEQRLSDLIQERERRLSLLTDAQQECEAAERKLAQKLEELEAARQQEASLRAEVEELRRERERLQSQVAEARERCDLLQREIAERNAEHDEAVRRCAAARDDLALINGEVSRRKQELEAARQQEASLRAQVEALHREREQLERQVAEARERRDQLQQEIEGWRAEREQARRQCALAADELARINVAVSRRKQELADINQAQEELRKGQARLEAELAALEQRKKAAEEELAKVRAEVQRAFENLQVVVQTDRDENVDPLGEFRELPHCFVRHVNSRSELDELDALAELDAHLKDRGLIYPQRFVEAFHTCLKIADISPLTVLAGISGTGKSALPREYADAMGMDLLVVPVQPRWDGPQDLIGFYNYVERRFKPTELARALVRFDRSEWDDVFSSSEVDVSQRMLLVLLDEMNLARVEYYFSDFLSLLELRRDSPDRARLIIDLGHGRQRPLQLSDNVLFVGTMNEDESTQTLADKVLDRANVIRFARPQQLLMPQTEKSARQTKPRLKRAVWDKWREPSSADPRELEELKKELERLNKILDRLGRPFGHRLFQAVYSYYRAHPAVARNERNARRIALADQLDMRILPRLRGLEINYHREGLDELRQLIDRLEDEPLQAAFQRACDAELFLWPGVQRG